MSLLGVNPEPACSCGSYPHDMDCAVVVERVLSGAAELMGPGRLAPCPGPAPGEGHPIDCACHAARTANAMTAAFLGGQL